ncbi:hypothetical protein VTH06DRAFT_8181 [Thermothelomyces fergusii]
MDSAFQDSPTVGRTVLYAAESPRAPPPSAAAPSRSRRVPASPLSMDSSFSPSGSAAIPRIVTTAASEDRPSQASEKSYFNSDSSGSTTPEERSPGPAPSPLSLRFPNEARRSSDAIIATRPPAAAPSSQFSTMSGPADERAEPARNPPRNSSIDSAISAISSKSSLQKTASQDGAIAPDEIANLIRTAGSAEAVIQYLLKEKQAQSQQNAQLWRLVDKQRAMILGLNKDLERALKEKEKYRKKLKEVLGVSEVVSAPSMPRPASQEASSGALDIPVSPKTVTPGEPKDSPVDVPLAPYPITPPVDQAATAHAPSAVGELLDPTHTMPKPSEHALDHYDHEAQEREAEAASKRADEAKEMPISMTIPPSRAAPSGPLPNPPPRPPVGAPDRPPRPEEGAPKFPPPLAPPPRKPPPAPLHLKNAKPKPSVAPEEDPETDTDYDHILEVDETNEEERRGRRRTREEDDRERAIQARKEAEMRSLSKKSKKSNSRKATDQARPPPAEFPADPRLAQNNQTLAPREPASLAGVLNGAPDSRMAPPPLLSPGLPASPRPIPPKSPLSSPPLSPFVAPNFGGVPLSPRPPRGPIPLPPNTPLLTPSAAGAAGDPLVLRSPRLANIKKQEEQGPGAPSPTKSSTDIGPTERTKIYKGFVTEEYPDLLLPPNALPSIDIKVASSRMKPSRASLIALTQLEEDPVFTLAVYSRADGGELWRIEKDSASLAKLDQRLKQCPAFTAKTPDRSLFTGHAPAKLDARRVALNQYLDELLNTPLDHGTALELCKYLSTNTLPPNADETGGSTGDYNGESSRLKYYETPGGAHLGTIKLKGAQIGKQAHHSNDGGASGQGGAAEDGDNQYRHAFLILEPKKKDPSSTTKHVLCAESDKERDQWVDTLLRWIDYRDPEDEEAPKKESHQERNGDRGGGKKKAGNSQAKRRGSQPQPQLGAAADEGLIGVSYETTKQGDIPHQGLPIKGKQPGQQDQESTHSQSTTSSYTISAPRDPQVISNSDAWGSKLGMGLPAPTQEEKKARKRSFFGFGPKTRTSSEGQDSLLGSEGSGSLPTGQYHGPVRQAFGASLAEAVKYNAPVDVNVPLPAVVYRCIQYLDSKKAIFEEGIFRLSGSNLVIKQLRERFNNEGDIDLLADGQYYDIHAIASLLKMYLRELPSTILTNELRSQFMAVTEMTDHQEKMAALAELVERLPQANAALLKYLISFLIKIIDHSDVNKMTVRNVGIVFSPTLNIPAPIFAMFLQNYEAIFGIDPAEYELPVTEPEYMQERRPSLPASFQERRPSDVRPSTSHSDSPHRHRLMESLDGQGNRGTPTPPPMTMQQLAQMNAASRHARSTPTPPPPPPPPQRQMSLDRPAYESSVGIIPPGLDPSHSQASSQQKAQAGHDRPMYENGLMPVPYEQQYRSRRESTIFMGTLSQQPSKSRLREETQYSS